MDGNRWHKTMGIARTAGKPGSDKIREDAADNGGAMAEMGRRARAASRALALAAPERKTAALKTAAQAIRDNASAILQANAEDIAAANG
jgi:hypothetical protein